MPGHCLKVRIALHQPGVVHHIADIGQGEKRLDSTGCAGNDADGASGRNGHRRRIAHPLDVARLVVNAALPGWEGAARVGQLTGTPIRLLLDAAHDLFGQFQRVFRVVADTQFHQQIGPTHDANANTTSSPAHLGDFGNGIVVHVDDIVQQMDRGAHHLGQPLPIDSNIVVSVMHHAGQVNRTQIARLVG